MLGNSKTKKPLTLRQTFARNIRLLRLHQGMSQEMLADKAQLDRAFVGTIERGERNVSIDNVEKICAALNARAHLLLDSDFPQKHGLNDTIVRAPRNARTRG